ncbi:polysaccharide lyase family 8 super-sandwich domain-containing protein [Lentisphaerota bacterium WC36G]|nr:polysaccharide lyase beta-sandwich domain-containing protein [Lentisphaerae bacterium WC36]
MISPVKKFAEKMLYSAFVSVVYVSFVYLNNNNLFAKEIVKQNHIDWQTIVKNIRKCAPEAIVWGDKNVTRAVDGSYPDIDYKSRVESYWPAFNHLTRLQNEIQYNYFRLNGESFKKLAPEFAKSFRYYLHQDPISDNWWFNEIGAPRHVAIISVYLLNYLTAGDLKKVVTLLSRAKIKLTGQNRIWLSSNAFYRALLTKNDSLAKEALENIFSELKYANKTSEGIQVDNSIHQHGNQQQFGNYGLAFTRTMSYWLSVLNNTSLFPAKDKLSVLRNFMLNGQRWTCFNGYMDINCCNRQFYVDNLTGKTSALLIAYKQMASIDKTYKDKYQAFIDSNEKHDRDNILTGNKYFYRSDFLFHRRKDFIFSVKMCSNRVIGAEAGNGENQQGYYTGDGVYWLMTRNNSLYNNIFSVLDWRKLPGATIPQSDEKLPVLTWSGYKNKSDFVGGVSDGLNGCAVFEANRDGVTGLKSYFFCDDNAVFLGANLKTKDKTKPLFTTVQQCLAENLEIREWGKNAVKANSVLYINLNPRHKMICEIKKQSGSWRNVYLYGSSDKVETKKILTIGFAHDDKVDSYAYAIMNNIGEVILNSASPFEVISNTKDVQGVEFKNEKNEKFVQLIFRNPAEVLTSIGKISVDKSLLLMINITSKTLTVADPTQKLSAATIKINRKNFSVDFPQGDYTGKSVIIKL